MDDGAKGDFREVLEEERRTALDRLAKLTEDFETVVDAAEGSNADDEHDPEGATIAFERSQLHAHAQQAQVRLTEIEDAVGRLEDGSFGSCEGCGRPIPGERLRVRPTARRCVGCASG